MYLVLVPEYTYYDYFWYIGSKVGSSVKYSFVTPNTQINLEWITPPSPPPPPRPIHQYVLPTHLYWIFFTPPLPLPPISNYGYGLLMISGIPWLLSGSRLVLQTEASCGILQASKLVFRKDFSKNRCSCIFIFYIK